MGSSVDFRLTTHLFLSTYLLNASLDPLMREIRNQIGADTPVYLRQDHLSFYRMTVEQSFDLLYFCHPIISTVIPIYFSSENNTIAAETNIRPISFWQDFSKSQLIFEWLFAIFNFSKTHPKNLMNFSPRILKVV